MELIIWERHHHIILHLYRQILVLYPPTMLLTHTALLEDMGVDLVMQTPSRPSLPQYLLRVLVVLSMISLPLHVPLPKYLYQVLVQSRLRNRRAIVHQRNRFEVLVVVVKVVSRNDRLHKAKVNSNVSITVLVGYSILLQ